MVLVKKLIFFSIFSFLGKISKENLFGDVLESKKSVSRQIKIPIFKK